MFSNKIKGRIAGLALVGAVFTIPAIASAGVVVKSSGPSAGSYPVGKKVADTSSITLRAGDRITVLTDDGTKVMQGPGTFRVGEGATRTRARFSNLTRKNAARRVRTGAVRGTGTGAVRSPNLWYVNVAASGTICLYDLASVRLWRPDASSGQTYTVTDNATNASLDVEFVETEAMRSLDPENFAVTDGGSYTITGPSKEGAGSAASSINVVALTEEYAAPDALAEALIDKGCTTQLGLLADTLEASVRR